MVPKWGHLRRCLCPSGQSSSRVASSAWTQAIAELLPGEVVAIDGKSSYDRAGSKRAMHLVSAWATRNTLTLGQVRRRTGFCCAGGRAIEYASGRLWRTCWLKENLVHEGIRDRRGRGIALTGCPTTTPRP